MTTEQPPYWWSDHDNIVLLAYWMKERDYGAEHFVSLIEKPWKWTSEYEEAVADNEAEEAAAVAEAEVDEVDAAIAESEIENRTDHGKARLEQEFKAGFDEVRP